MYDLASAARDGEPEKVASVRFIKSASGYRQGETAGFPLDTAKAIVDRGIGEYVREIEREVEQNGQKRKIHGWEPCDRPNIHVPAFGKSVEDAPNKMQTASVKK